MRLHVLNDGYGIGPRILFKMVRVVSSHPLPDAAKLTFYRPDYYGSGIKAFLQRVMRGPSGWTVGERELMAAAVARLNESPFCIAAHTATAVRALGDPRKVEAALATLGADTAGEPLEHVLGLLAALIHDGEIDDARLRAALAAGTSPEQIEDAFAVCFAFTTTARLANAFGFEQLSPEAFAAGAKYLLRRGYR